MSRPEKWRGRVYAAELHGWWFEDTHESFIPEECREDEIASLETLQQDNMDHAKRLFHPSNFEERKRK